MSSPTPRVQRQYTDDQALIQGSHQGNGPLKAEIIAKNVQHVNARDEEGNTALLISCDNLHLANIDALLALGADPNIANHKGETPLMIASKNGNKKYIAALLEHGGDPNIRDETGKTALMHSFSGYVDKDDHEYITNILLQNGAHIDDRDNENNSCLMMADSMYNQTGIDTLIKNGANRYELSTERPLYIDDPSNQSNIYNNSSKLWTDITSTILVGVSNIGMSKYPVAHLNKDNTISIFIDKEDYKKQSFYQPDLKDLDESFNHNHFKTQLHYQLSLQGIHNKEPEELVEINEGNMGITEYKINIPPENLNSILNLTPHYTGYKDNNSLLKLNKDFSLSEGNIRLFPAFPIDEEGKLFSIQTAGCQFPAMTTIQLLHLLPNYENEIAPQHKQTGNNFHRIPKEVTDQLLIDELNFPKIIRKIAEQNSVSITENGHSNFHETPDILETSKMQTNSAIKIKAMSSEDRDFYAMYGNIDHTLLEKCVSVEVDRVALLKIIKDNIKQQQPDTLEDQHKASEAKSTTKSMIQNARNETPSVLSKVLHKLNETISYVQKNHSHVPGMTTPDALTPKPPESKPREQNVEKAVTILESAAIQHKKAFRDYTSSHGGCISM